MLDSQGLEGYITGACLRRIAYLPLLAIAAIFLIGCPKANTDYNAGRKAEALDDYDTALVNYERALRSEPTNVEYKLRATHVRYEDSQFHLEQGEKALQKGDLQLALGEFQKAQAVDPSNAAADQEVKKAMDLLAAKNQGCNAPRPYWGSGAAPRGIPRSRHPVTLLRKRGAKGVVRIVIIGVQAQRLTVFSDRTVHVAFARERQAEVDVRQFILGVQAQRLTEFRDRAILVALARQRLAKAEVRTYKIGVQTQRLTILRDRTVQVTLLLERGAKDKVRPLIVRVQAHRFALLGNVSIPVALESERGADAVVRKVIIWIQAQRLAVFRNRAV